MNRTQRRFVTGRFDGKVNHCLLTDNEHLAYSYQGEGYAEEARVQAAHLLNLRLDQLQVEPSGAGYGGVPRFRIAEVVPFRPMRRRDVVRYKEVIDPSDATARYVLLEDYIDESYGMLMRYIGEQEGDTFTATTLTFAPTKKGRPNEIELVVCMLGCTCGLQENTAFAGTHHKSCERFKELKDFQVGQRVRLADDVRHAEFRGMIGTVRRLVKSRNVVVVEGVTDSGFEKRYDADPGNVEALEPFEVPLNGMHTYQPEGA